MMRTMNEDQWHGKINILLVQEYAMHLSDVASRVFDCVTKLEFDLKTYNQWSIRMAKKDSKPQESGIGEWKGIANIAITSEHKAAAENMVREGDVRVTERVSELLAADYKIVLRWDERSNCPSVSLSCYNEASPNYKRTLITRAPLWDTAFALMGIKHFEIASGDWTADSEEDKWS